VIFGGVGSDLIFDGVGKDTTYGGHGGDHVVLDADGASDTVHCGPGHDVVLGATPGENTIAADCEEVHVGGCSECFDAARAVQLESRLSSRGPGLVVRPAALLH
jgi:hypothetical protein